MGKRTAQEMIRKAEVERDTKEEMSKGKAKKKTLAYEKVLKWKATTERATKSRQEMVDKLRIRQETAAKAAQELIDKEKVRQEKVTKARRKAEHEAKIREKDFKRLKEKESEAKLS